MAALKPETKARRVVRAEAELRKAEKKWDGFDARKAKAEAALANYTDEKRAAYEKRYEEAERMADYVAAAPVADEEEYQRILAELRAEAEANEAATDESENVANAA